MHKVVYKYFITAQSLKVYWQMDGKSQLGEERTAQISVSDKLGHFLSVCLSVYLSHTHSNINHEEQDFVSMHEYEVGTF